MEWNHRNILGRNRDASTTSVGPEIDQISDNGFASGNHGFSRRLSSNDDTEHEHSEDVTPHIITRMPDLTGYGRDAAPQNISFYRPKYGRLKINLKYLKKLSFQKWCAIAAGVVVIFVIALGIFRKSDVRHDLAQNPPVATIEAINPPSPSFQPHERTAELHFGQSGEKTPTFQSPDRQPGFFSGSDAPPAPHNDYFGAQSVVPADSATSSGSQFPAGMSGIATVMPDASSRELAPWDRQPNQQAMAAGSPNPSQQGFSGNSNEQASGTTNPAWPPYDPNTGGNPQWQNGNAPTYAGAAGNMSQPVPQNTYPANAYSQNGQAQPASQPQGFAGMAAEYASANSANATGNAVYQQNPTSRQIAEGFGAAPQQVYYQQSPASHDNAVAINTNNMPSYSQGGQWPPQNAPNMPQNTGMQNNFAPQNQQQPYPGNGPSFAGQGNAQPAPQYGMSNVPVLASGQSYRDPSVTGANLSGTINQYPGNPRQPSPYNTANSQPQDIYR